jgi:myosin-5
MGSQIELQQENNVCLSYWLSNTVTLLFLLQKNIKPASGGSYNARLRSPATRSDPPFLMVVLKEEAAVSPSVLLHDSASCGDAPLQNMIGCIGG